MTQLNKNILRRPKVEHKTGLGKSSIYRLIQLGKFPKPLKLTDQSVGWLESEIDQWIDERQRADVMTEVA